MTAQEYSQKVITHQKKEKIPMKSSMFNIVVEDGRKTLLYNTLTTSMISLNNELYRGIL